MRKPSRMKFIQYFEPIIVALKELGGSGTPQQVRNRVAAILGVSGKELSETLGDGKKLRYNTNVAFARQYLVWHGYLSNSERGKWALTEAGKAVQRISPEAALRIFDTRWRNHRHSRGQTELQPLSEEVSDGYPEGTRTQVWVNRYERDPEAREKCIVLHGLQCCICNFNFERAYGEIGRGFIHVHHIKPLSEVGDDYVVNPKDDMCPICPNCHAFVHRHPEPLSPEDVRKRLRKSEKLALKLHSAGRARYLARTLK